MSATLPPTETETRAARARVDNVVKAVGRTTVEAALKLRAPLAIREQKQWKYMLWPAPDADVRARSSAESEDMADYFESQDMARRIVAPLLTDVDVGAR